MIVHEGKNYARVSDILRPFNNFGHIDPSVLENKARIGTSAHQAIADDIAGEFPCPDKDSMGYFKSYEMWRDKVHPTFLQSEKRYFDGYRMITGQIDALITFSEINFFPVLVDFKTSSVESKEVWPMQAHLYALLLATNQIQVSPKYLFIKLDKHGSLPAVYEYSWDRNIHAKCMDAIDSFWQNNTK